MTPFNFSSGDGALVGLVLLVVGWCLKEFGPAAMAKARRNGNGKHRSGETGAWETTKAWSRSGLALETLMKIEATQTRMLVNEQQILDSLRELTTKVVVTEHEMADAKARLNTHSERERSLVKRVSVLEGRQM